MKLRAVVVCTFVLAVAAPAVFAGNTPVRAGKWEMSMQMEIPGMPFKMPPMKVTHCVTEEDAQSAIPKDGKSKDCKVGDVKVDGNTISYTIDCPKQKMTGSGELTYEEDTMTGELKMNSDGQEMTTKYTGKRLGDCDK